MSVVKLFDHILSKRFNFSATDLTQGLKVKNGLNLDFIKRTATKHVLHRLSAVCRS